MEYGTRASVNDRRNGSIERLGAEPLRISKELVSGPLQADSQTGEEVDPPDYFPRLAVSTAWVCFYNQGMSYLLFAHN